MSRLVPYESMQHVWIPKHPVQNDYLFSKIELFRSESRSKAQEFSFSVGNQIRKPQKPKIMQKRPRKPAEEEEEKNLRKPKVFLPGLTQA